MPRRLGVTLEKNENEVQSESEINIRSALANIIHADECPQDDIGNLEKIRVTLSAAGFDHIPAYSVLRDTEDNGGAEGLRRAARIIREVHGGIYRTAAMLWAKQPGLWEEFPADPIPRRVIRIRDGQVWITSRP